MSKKIALDKVTLEFDERSGYIHLKSADRLLKGKPMMLKVTGGSPSYESLLQLMKIKSGDQLGEVGLTTSRTVSDFSKLLPMSGLPSDLVIGENLAGPEIWNLKANPHSLIVGAPGSGMSTIPRLIAIRAALDPRVLIYGVDPRGIDLPESYFGANDRRASTLSEIESTMDDIIDIINSRYAILERAKVLDLSELPAGRRFPLVFLVQESLEAMVELYGDDPRGLDKHFDKLATILRLGRTTGIHCFQSSNGSSLRSLPENLLNRFTRRVTFGRMSNELTKEALGDYGHFSGSYLLPLCRAIVRNYSEQTLVQAFFVPDDNCPWSPVHINGGISS